MLAAPAVLGASRAGAAGATFKLGYVSPQTDPPAGFGEADGFIIEAAKTALAGLTNTGAPMTVEIISKDSQSLSNRAAKVTTQLIESGGVQLVLAQGAPDTTTTWGRMRLADPMLQIESAAVSCGAA